MKSHLFRLFKGSAIYGLGSALNQMLGLLLLPLFTAYLSPADYGVIATLFMATMVINAVFAMGMGVSTAIVYSDPKNKGRPVITTALALLTLSSLTMLILFVPNLGFFSQQVFGQLGFEHLTLLSLLQLAFSLMGIPLALWLQLEEKQSVFVVLSLFNTLCTLGLSILMIVVLRLGVEGRLLAMMVASGIYFIGLWLAVPNKNWGFESDLAKQLIRYGLPTIPSFASLFVIQQGAVFALKRFSSLSQIGLYSVGNSFGNAMSLPVTAFSTSWVPFALSLQHDPEEASAVFSKVLTYFLAGMGLINLLLFAYAKALVVVFTKPEFYLAYYMIGLGACCHFLAGLFNILSIETYLAKEIHLTTLCQLLAAISLGLMLWPLTTMLHALGASLAMVGGYLVQLFAIIAINHFRKRAIRIQLWTRGNLFCLTIYISCALYFSVQPEVFSWKQFVANHLLLVLAAVLTYRLGLGEQERQFVARKMSGLFSKSTKAVS